MADKKTQIEVVRDILLTEGSITNFRAINQRISLRLGAIIHTLRKSGMQINGRFLDGTKNYIYELQKND